MVKGSGSGPCTKMLLGPASFQRVTASQRRQLRAARLASPYPPLLWLPMANLPYWGWADMALALSPHRPCDSGPGGLLTDMRVSRFTPPAPQSPASTGTAFPLQKSSCTPVLLPSGCEVCDVICIPPVNQPRDFRRWRALQEHEEDFARKDQIFS